MQSNPEYPAQPSVLFKIHCDVPASQSPCVVGSISALGCWDCSKALPLYWNPTTGFWEGTALLGEETDTFEYRLAVRDNASGALLRYESQGNRTADLSRLKPGPTGIKELHNCWEGVIGRFVIHHPTSEGQVLGVIGAHEQLGNWQKPKSMTLGSPRRLLTGAIGRCWEFTFPVSGGAVAVDYYYLIIDNRAGTAIWEREPDRRIVFPPVSEVVNGMVEIFDANFVSGMDFDAVPPAMFIGPYPQTLNDIDAMKAHGVTAVINVQTDEDIALRRVDWDGFLDRYRQLGIDCHRLPIRDFDAQDLTDKLPAAVHLLKRLVDEGKQVYVHCTAGMGRAPAVVIAYLIRYHDKNPEEALAHVKRHRQIVCPNMSAVCEAIRRGI